MLQLIVYVTINCYYVTLYNYVTINCITMLQLIV